MILDFFGREGEASKNLKIMGGFGGGWHRADNAVRLINDNVKYIIWLYIILLIVETGV